MNRKIPMRQCVGCGQMHEKREMMRVVHTTEGTVTLDFKGKTNGRGAYLCKSGDCLEKAIKNKGLERSLKTAIPEEMVVALKKEFELAE